ncbi:MAG: hypothetical protein ABID45_00270, partial [Patescibacteria group bacterium]
IYWQKDKINFLDQTNTTNQNINSKIITNLNTNSGQTGNTNQDDSEPVDKSDKDAENELKSFARSFTERFGSFSNQNDFENIEDIKIYMTKDMQKWSDNYVESEKKLNPKSENYYGITTDVINMETVNFDNNKGTGELKITTRRKESKESEGTEDTITQKASVKFVKDGNAWKVNQFTWL